MERGHGNGSETFPPNFGNKKPGSTRFCRARGSVGGGCEPGIDIRMTVSAALGGNGAVGKEAVRGIPAAEMSMLKIVNDYYYRQISVLARDFMDFRARGEGGAKLCRSEEGSVHRIERG